ncbi:MAG: hypothetical protein V2A74_10555, partial [bacterium]
IQRLVLLLKSDCHIEVVKTKRWTVRQFVALVALALFGWFTPLFGFGEGLFALAIPFGVVSILLLYWRNRSTRKVSREEIVLIPFSQVSEILRIRRRIAGFFKKKYPSRLRSREIRTRSSALMQEAPFYAFWLIFSPIVLLFQAFPETELEHRVSGP